MRTGASCSRFRSGGFLAREHIRVIAGMHLQRSRSGVSQRWGQLSPAVSGQGRGSRRCCRRWACWPTADSCRPARLETPGELQQFQRQRHRKTRTRLRTGDVEEKRVSDTSGDPDSGGGGGVARVVHPAGDAGMPIPRLQAASLPRRVSPDWMGMQIHGSCASRDGNGVLLIGPPGAGKSDLVLRLLARGFDLVADDRVDIEDGVARTRTGTRRPAGGAGAGDRAAAPYCGGAAGPGGRPGRCRRAVPAPMRHDG